MFTTEERKELFTQFQERIKENLPHGDGPVNKKDIAAAMRLAIDEFRKEGLPRSELQLVVSQATKSVAQEQVLDRAVGM